MANRHTVKGRSKHDAAHVRLYHWMLKAPAWQSLTPVAGMVYLEMARRYNGTNNGQIVFSDRMCAGRPSLSKSNVDRALKELQAKGFVEKVTPGGFNRKVRHATEWRLTAFRCDVTQEMATKAFMSWRPEI